MGFPTGLDGARKRYAAPRRAANCNIAMSWTTEHTHRIVEQYWQGGFVRCPDDNGPLKLKLRKLHGCDYDLQAECAVCGKRKAMRRGDDPERHRFRRWTPDEVQRLVVSTERIGASRCPVCNTPIEWQSAPSVLLLRCFRCGNSNQWQDLWAPA